MFPSAGWFVSQGAVSHHYLECESVRSLQFGLYSVAWGSSHCLLWVVLFTEAYARSIPCLADHPDSDGRTVLGCHSGRKGPLIYPFLTSTSDVIPCNLHLSFLSLATGWLMSFHRNLSSISPTLHEGFTSHLLRKELIEVKSRKSKEAHACRQNIQNSRALCVT